MVPLDPVLLGLSRRACGIHCLDHFAARCAFAVTISTWSRTRSQSHECQVNTHSAPDGVELSQIVTLVSHNYVKSLRHGIYEHEGCAKVISDWVRSQLGAERMRREIG